MVARSGKILTDTLLLNAAGLISQALGIVQRLLVMSFLDPGEFGVWMGLSIVLLYAGYVHGGLEHGMGFRLPYYRGRNDPERERQIEQTVFSIWSILAVMAAMGVAVWAIFAGGTPLYRFGLLAVAIMIPLEQQTQFLARWATTARADFALASQMAAIRSVAALVVIVPMAALWNIWGVIAGSVIVSSVTAVLWHVRAGFSVRWRIAPEPMREVLRVGFPILLVVLGGALIESIDRLLILGMLGTVSLGYYGITGLGGNAVYGFLSQAGSAMSPHMVEDMGRSGDSSRVLERYLVSPTLLFAVAAAILTTALMFIVPPAVRLFIPQYVPGIAAFYAFVPGFFFLAIILSANNIVNLVLISRQQQRRFLYVQGLALMCEVGLGYFLIRSGLGLLGVALASTAAYAVYGVITLGLAVKFVLPAGARFRFLAAVISPLAYCLVLAALILSSGLGSDGRIPGAIAALATYAVACLPLVIWADRRVPFIGRVWALRAIKVQS